jgi:predicted ferric reductase
MKKIAIPFFLLVTLLSAHAALAQEVAQVPAAVPWAWYVSRAAALLAFSLLYVSVFFGLAIRIPFLAKLVSQVNSLRLHRSIAVQALLLALIHGAALMGDKTINFTPTDVFVPFATSYETDLVALGIIAFYMMAVLIATSYGKKFLPQSFWRATHSLNIGLYVIAVTHALYLGTDLKIAWVHSIFIWANVALALLFAYNIFVRIILSIQQRRKRKEINKNLEIL